MASRWCGHRGLRARDMTTSPPTAFWVWRAVDSSCPLATEPVKLSCPTGAAWSAEPGASSKVMRATIYRPGASELSVAPRLAHPSVRGSHAAPSHPAPGALAPCSMRLVMSWCNLLSAACIASTAWHGKSCSYRNRRLVIERACITSAWRRQGACARHRQHPEKLQLQMASSTGSAR